MFIYPDEEVSSLRCHHCIAVEEKGWDSIQFVSEVKWSNSAAGRD